MAFEIVPATTEDFPALVQLFKENNFALKEQTWFDWKHNANPYGGPYVFKILYEGKLAGSVGLQCQQFQENGRTIPVCQLVDGLMGPAIRGKRLFAPTTQFMTKPGLSGDHVPEFHIGFASVISSMKALENAGFHRLAAFHVRKAMLTPGALKTRRFGSFLAALATPFWGIMRGKLFAAASDDLEVSPITKFSEDLESFQPADRICGDRCPEFMNWRVLDHPRDDLRAFAVSRKGEMVGYLICKVLGATWEVLEFRSSLPGAAVLATFLKFLHGQGGVDSVDFWLMEGFFQEENLPDGLLDRGSLGAMFTHGAKEAGYPEDNTRWACSYLDSDW
jgi:hypothetical protein